MKEKARFLRILGDETKLRIIQHLLKGELCVCKIIPITGRAQSTVSTHLNDLEKTGVLESRRVGKYIHYKIKNKKVYGLCKLLGIKKAKAKKIKCRRR